MLESLVSENTERQSSRRFPRMKPDDRAKIIVTLEHRGEEVAGELDDISVGGIGLKIFNVRYGFPVNSLMKVTIETPDEKFSMYALIVYVHNIYGAKVRKYGQACYENNTKIIELIDMYC